MKEFMFKKFIEYGNYLENKFPIIWKVVDYPGVRENMYEISNTGQVRNKNTKQILHQYFDKCGYLMTFLSIPGREKGKQFKVHRLVAFSFIPNPEDKPEVNHIDGLKNNNHVNNLEWVTSSENQKTRIQVRIAKDTKRGR